MCAWASSAERETQYDYRFLVLAILHGFHRRGLARTDAREDFQLIAFKHLEVEPGQSHYERVREICRGHGTRMREGEVTKVTMALVDLGGGYNTRVQFNETHGGFSAIEFFVPLHEVWGLTLNG